MKHEHIDPVRAISAEPALQAAIDACKDSISFDAGWSVVKGRFESPARFVGEIAYTFPGTAQIKGDFSNVKAERDEFGTTHTILSLVCVVHSKQLSMISSLRTLASVGYVETTCSKRFYIDSIQ